ncbi:MAG: hypothetical protein PHC51_12050, partial [bacterium]|nr:hypothetical protein [bacterium]
SMKEVGTTISKMNEISAVIKTAIQEQQLATQEIARNASSSAQATDSVKSDAEQLKEAAIITSHGANDLLAASAEVAEQAERLSSASDSFLQTIRGG